MCLLIEIGVAQVAPAVLNAFRQGTAMRLLYRWAIREHFSINIIGILISIRGLSECVLCVFCKLKIKKLLYYATR